MTQVEEYQNLYKEYDKLNNEWFNILSNITDYEDNRLAIISKRMREIKAKQRILKDFLTKEDKEELDLWSEELEDRQMNQFLDKLNKC